MAGQSCVTPRFPELLLVLEHRFELALQLLHLSRRQKCRVVFHAFDGQRALGRVETGAAHRHQHRLGRAIAQLVLRDSLLPVGVDGLGTQRAGPRGGLDRRDGHGGRGLGFWPRRGLVASR